MLRKQSPKVEVCKSWAAGTSIGAAGTSDSTSLNRLPPQSGRWRHLGLRHRSRHRRLAFHPQAYHHRQQPDNNYPSVTLTRFNRTSIRFRQFPLEFN